MAKQTLLSDVDIDKHIYNHTKKLGVPAKFNSGNLTAFNLCQVYTIARPVLIFAKALLFFRPTWISGITALISVLDTQCNVKD